MKKSFKMETVFLFFENWIFDVNADVKLQVNVFVDQDPFYFGV